MNKPNDTVRIRPALLAEAVKVAAAEGLALDDLVDAALVEKLRSLQALRSFTDRAARGRPSLGLDVLARAGLGNPPMPGDELG